jgi:hypothetical protein
MVRKGCSEFKKSVNWTRVFQCNSTNRPVRLALSSKLNVRFATPGHIPGSEQKRTFTILHCEAVFNLVLKNNEPLQSFGNAKPLVNEMAAPFVHETCLYAVFEYEAMDRSL